MTSLVTFRDRAGDTVMAPRSCGGCALVAPHPVPRSLMRWTLYTGGGGVGVGEMPAIGVRLMFA